MSKKTTEAKTNGVTILHILWLVSIKITQTVRNNSQSELPNTNKPPKKILARAIHRPIGKGQEIGFAILPSERNKDYCSEATMIMVDYLLLSKHIAHVQAHTCALASYLKNF